MTRLQARTFLKTSESFFFCGDADKVGPCSGVKDASSAEEEEELGNNLDVLTSVEAQRRVCYLGNILGFDVQESD